MYALFFDETIFSHNVVYNLLMMVGYIKKYVIHIMAVTAISEEGFDIPLDKCAMITLTTRYKRYYKCEPLSS